MYLHVGAFVHVVKVLYLFVINYVPCDKWPCLFCRYRECDGDQFSFYDTQNKTLETLVVTQSLLQMCSYGHAVIPV